MAVGDRFMDSETQAAIAAQAGQVGANAQKDQSQAAEAQETAKAEAAEKAKADAEAQAAAETNAVDTAAAGAAAETEQSAETDLNMEKVEIPSQEEIDKALESAGFSNEALGKEMLDNKGKLTKDTVAKLKEKFDPAQVDAVVADMEKQWDEKYAEADADLQEQAKSINEMNDFIYGSLAGGDVEKGKENLKTLSEWCQKNMQPEDLATANALLRSGDKVAVKRGLEMAVSQWKKGQEKPMMSADATALNAEKETPKFVPLSRDQYIRAIASKKYNEDAEYAAEVDARRRKTMETEGAMTPEFSHLRPPI